MYESESVEVELTDNEARSINNDDSKYSKCSALVSSKLGISVEAQGFPSKVEKQKLLRRNQPKKKKPQRRSHSLNLYKQSLLNWFGGLSNYHSN